MRDLLRFTQSEFIKMRHTKLFWIHLLVPGAGAAAFLLYYTFAPWDAAAKVQAYVEALAVVYPFLAGLICSMSVELEEEGNMQTFLIVSGRKCCAFIGKWLALNLSSLAACALAVLGFAAGYELMIGQNPIPLRYYMVSTLLLWLGQTVLYSVYLFLSLKYAKAAALAAGILGTVLAALMLTGLGDGCWPIIPLPGVADGAVICYYMKQETRRDGTKCQGRCRRSWQYARRQQPSLRPGFFSGFTIMKEGGVKNSEGTDPGSGR